MAPENPSLSSQSHRIVEWRAAYQAVRNETDTKTLFKCVEVAEAAALTRRAQLQKSSEQEAEMLEIEAAIQGIRMLKRERLGFDDGSRASTSRRQLKRTAGYAPPGTQ